MNYQLSYSIEIYFTLTDEEFKILTHAMNNSEYSYDTKQGGFWYGAINLRTYLNSKSKKERETDTFHHASSRDVQKLCKSLEPYGNGWLRDETGVKLYHTLYKLISSSLARVNQLNSKPEIQTI